MGRILVAGATGYIGTHLCRHLIDSGYEISALSRKVLLPTKGIRFFNWDVENGVIDPDAFDGVDVIINLTGANIGTESWSAKRKHQILRSRTDSLQLLFESAKEYKAPIKTLLSASASGYYGAVTSGTIFEEDGKPGNDFLADVCVQWEKAAKRFEELDARVVILRQGVVVGQDDVLYSKMAPLAKLGINPAVGNGKQYIPWIDIHDLVRMYTFFIQKEKANGVYNAVSSDHATMNNFAEELLKSFRKSTFIPNVPAFMIKLLLGERSMMMLNGSRVSNEKVKKEGFAFLHDDLRESLRSISSKTSS